MAYFLYSAHRQIEGIEYHRVDSPYLSSYLALPDSDEHGIETYIRYALQSWIVPRHYNISREPLTAELIEWTSAKVRVWAFDAEYWYGVDETRKQALIDTTDEETWGQVERWLRAHVGEWIIFQSL